MSKFKEFDFYIDRGGTFTDVFYRIFYDGELQHEKVIKLLSVDPANYPDAPREAIRRALFAELKSHEFGDANKAFPASGKNFSVRLIRMGTTVATNALLERKGAKTAFVSSKGFKDLLEIGYQNRPGIFALNIKKPKQLYQEVIEFDQKTIDEDLLQLKMKGIESLALALKHSYKDDSEEKLVEELARKVGFKKISLSSALVPMIKLVPRASTTVIDAYLSPIIFDYIENFKQGFSDCLDKTELLFMKSDGGLAQVEDFRGYNSILSGPAGGVTALNSLYRGKALIGFDMGGTSTDVSRASGKLNINYDSEIEGLLLQSPQLDINTVAAGGGSRLFYENGMFRVGPESAGAHPGPVSYRKGGHLAITDANLVLGRLNPHFFPKVFGPNADESISYELACQAFEKLKEENNLDLSIEEIAAGFIKVANETMARPIREVSSLKGFDVKKHHLVCFGGAGGAHACAIARSLGISKIIIHKHSGILSAYGISQANETKLLQKSFAKPLNESLAEIESVFAEMAKDYQDYKQKKSLLLRFDGTDTKFLVHETEDLDYEKAFKENYLREFGFSLDREILCEDIILDLIKTSSLEEKEYKNYHLRIDPIGTVDIYFDRWHKAYVFKYDDLPTMRNIIGPAMIMQDTATIVLEPGTQALINKKGDLEITIVSNKELNTKQVDNNPINLAIFANRFMSIAEQMGKVLERTSISTNIKERRDFSCAIFDKGGNLIANAPHQPVHLGSMGHAVKCQIANDAFKNGATILTNHPAMGGSHLPDMTVITPLIIDGEIEFYLANRGHHADIGGISPGSMPSFSESLDQEGLAIKSFDLVSANEFQESKLRDLLKESRLLEDNISDLRAQVAANKQGISLLEDLISEYSLDIVSNFMSFIMENSKNSVAFLLKNLEANELSAEDYLDDGSIIKLKISIDKDSGKAVFDFTGTAAELKSNLNTPEAVTSSAVLYALRCLINEEIPLNQGCLEPVEIIIPDGSLLKPSENAPVVGGNVQTSQRIVDVIFKAFGAVAASQGCMNNLTLGNETFGYYETIGGGAGAGLDFDGASGTHTHMTNTRITDPEILESRYPVILEEFSIRKGSGGKGAHNGGDGLVRTFSFLDKLSISLLTERRNYKPYGLNGGEDGACGENWLIKKNGEKLKLDAKTSIEVDKDDKLMILTPGGGAYGRK